MARRDLVLDNGAVAVMDIEALELLKEYGPATAEQLAGHRFQPFSTFPRENTLPPPRRTIWPESTLAPLRMPAVGRETQRILDEMNLEAALRKLERQGMAISVTTGRGKRQQTLWMTPQRGRELMDGIRRALE
jgi:hypothetical protein